MGPVASSANAFDMDAAITPTIGPAKIGNLFILDITVLSIIDFGVTKFASEPRGSIIRMLCRLERLLGMKSMIIQLVSSIINFFQPGHIERRGIANKQQRNGKEYHDIVIAYVVFYINCVNYKSSSS